MVLVSGGAMGVRAVRMGRVSMGMCMGGLDIGPAFRVERRFERNAAQAANAAPGAEADAAAARAKSAASDERPVRLN